MDKKSQKSPLEGTECPAWLEGDKKVLKSIAAIFVRNVPSQLERLREACDGNDAGLIEMLSHKLKGSASMIGARSLYDAALKIESAAIEGATERARVLFGDVEIEMKNVLAALTEMK